MDSFFGNLSRSLLGGWGAIVQDFYLEHDLIINSLIIIWGITMIVIRRRKNRKTVKGQHKEDSE